MLSLTPILLERFRSRIQRNSRSGSASTHAVGQIRDNEDTAMLATTSLKAFSLLAAAAAAGLLRTSLTPAAAAHTPSMPSYFPAPEPIPAMNTEFEPRPDILAVASREYQYIPPHLRQKEQAPIVESKPSEQEQKQEQE